MAVPSLKLLIPARPFLPPNPVQLILLFRPSSSSSAGWRFPSYPETLTTRDANPEQSRSHDHYLGGFFLHSKCVCCTPHLSSGAAGAADRSIDLHTSPRERREKVTATSSDFSRRRSIPIKQRVRVINEFHQRLG